MRKAVLATCVLAVALLLQLTVLNGLQLPGGGVPDLILVLVAAVAMSAGPIPGMVAGFAAGLCIDLAPPGSAVIGQYALVFCLTGWACGRARGLVTRSALGALGALAVVLVAAESLIAVLGRALAPAQVTMSAIKQVLPSTVGYDLLLAPLVLYLVLLVSSWLEHGFAAESGGVRLLPDSSRARRRAAKQPQPHQPRLHRAAARPGDGWLYGGQRGLVQHRPPAGPGRRLRPGAGVPGSASGLIHQRPGMPPARPVNLRLASQRRRAAGPGRHPGMLSGARTGGGGFRPHGGEPGGSAAAGFRRVAVPIRRPSSIMFGGRSDSELARSLRAAAGLGATRRRSAPRLRLAGGKTGELPAPRAVPTPRLRFTGSKTSAVRTRRPSPEPRLRLAGSKTTALSASRPAPAPKLNFHSHRPAPSRHRPASPRFRGHSPGPRHSALSDGQLAGALDQQLLRQARRSVTAPRLRLGRGRNAAGMLGGTGGSPMRRTRSVRRVTPHFRSRPLAGRAGGPSTKRPKFGYGRRSLLSFLASKHIGGRWVASQRVGSRSGVWLLGRRGGPR